MDENYVIDGNAVYEIASDCVEDSAGCRKPEGKLLTHILTQDGSDDEMVSVYF